MGPAGFGETTRQTVSDEAFHRSTSYPLLFSVGSMRSSFLDDPSAGCHCILGGTGTRGREPLRK